MNGAGTYLHLPSQSVSDTLHRILTCVLYKKVFFVSKILVFQQLPHHWYTLHKEPSQAERCSAIFSILSYWSLHDLYFDFYDMNETYITIKRLSRGKPFQTNQQKMILEKQSTNDWTNYQSVGS